MKKKVIPVVLSATLLTSFLGTSGALAAENRTTTPVPVTKTAPGTIPTGMPGTIPTKAALNGDYQTQGVVSWSYKAFRAACRSGGWLLSKALKPFSPKAAAWIRKNSKKVADIMDKGENWGVKQFTKAFKAIGAPTDVATTLAKFIVALI
ncbi:MULTISPECIES: hypothetical protein [Bacillus]|jgi:hypothetical protein|uniref:hypothetical protein n=1 Tax=Bacillus TaxID=1386 RepID=UPI000472E5FE|nr:MULTISPECIES: hypothetical protein [Bacillus]SLB95603.1 Uncharacterised protein [Mycobacteroides abscessus subsp. massiliense]AMQ71588.1 hypothetical protein BAMY6639_13580 [Bacillus amyloliquefaciens UMAF6639]AMR49247.1 hypothetical protein A1R12_02295 [Bacillus amyloliquefaciens]ASB51829.1 hypothetical protein S100072_00458 [Bacillus velezensis]ASB63950.1 hypothetical protein S101413_00468 [Bacillus velezensis]